MVVDKIVSRVHNHAALERHLNILGQKPKIIPVYLGLNEKFETVRRETVKGRGDPYIYEFIEVEEERSGWGSKLPEKTFNRCFRAVIKKQSLNAHVIAICTVGPNYPDVPCTWKLQVGGNNARKQEQMKEANARGKKRKVIDGEDLDLSAYENRLNEEKYELPEAAGETAKEDNLKEWLICHQLRRIHCNFDLYVEADTYHGQCEGPVHGQGGREQRGREQRGRGQGGRGQGGHSRGRR